MKVNTTRIEVTVMAVALLVLVALAIAPAFWGNAFGQQSRTSTDENAANPNRTIGDGQQYSIEGIVTMRADGEFTVCAKDRSETVVVVNGKTNIKTVRKGLFRRDAVSAASEIVRGLRLRVEGTGNAEGELVARIVRFGYGSGHPVAGNNTRTGRAQNRRAAIRINKGIISQAGSPERTAVVNLTNVP